MAGPILIAGAAGVFGGHLARELAATTDAELILSARTLERAERACAGLLRARPMAIDLGDPGALGRAARGCLAVACTAGPFQALSLDLVRATLDAGARWLDIADAPEWILAARDLGAQSGLSTTPALSCELVSRLRTPATRRARITLWIGNRNAKGVAAVESALTSFGAATVVDLPVGRYRALAIPSADGAILGLDAQFQVAFEWPLATRIMALCAGRPTLAPWLARAAAPLSRFGSDAGCLHVELDDGPAASLLARHRGQRLAILPCALAIEDLLAAPTAPWFDRMQQRGVDLVFSRRQEEGS